MGWEGLGRVGRGWDGLGGVGRGKDGLEGWVGRVGRVGGKILLVHVRVSVAEVRVQ